MSGIATEMLKKPTQNFDHLILGKAAQNLDHLSPMDVRKKTGLEGKDNKRLRLNSLLTQGW